jgi:hypothetical protein
MLIDYTRKHSKLKLLHKICGKIWEPKAKKFIEGGTCPYCRGSSKGEAIIEAFLMINNIKYKAQYKFEDCKYKATLPFDFATFDSSGNLVYLIEFDGVQHIETNTSCKYCSSTVKVRDLIKTKYANDNGINLLRILEGENILEVLQNVYGNTLIPTVLDVHASYKQKVSPKLAADIRKAFLSGSSRKELEVEHSLCGATVRNILNYTIHKDIPCLIKEEVLKTLNKKLPGPVMTKLIPLRSQFIELKLENKSFREIGRIFNTSHGMVKKIINYEN